MAPRPLILLHGYSDSGKSFGKWRDYFAALDRPVREIYTASYVSKTNEVTIPDLGEAFDRAIAGALPGGQDFDIIVHSTGMLVIREWMTRGAHRRNRVKHLIGLAPATWGSPLAHKGNSWLGAAIKGERHWGPDFAEAGKEILIGLELGSPYTWQLAERDLLSSEVWYGEDDTTPWPFIFVGTEPYGGLRKFANEPGTDGTVRWSGVGFNCRKFRLDLTLESGGGDVTLEPWRNLDVPLVFVEGKNHGSLLHEPSTDLGEMISAALEVDSQQSFDGWRASHAWKLEDKGRYTNREQWQQFVIRAVDERGNAVPDWFLELCTVADDGSLDTIHAFDVDVHAFGPDSSYRCFHVDLSKLPETGPRLGVRLAARSGTDYVAYFGVNAESLELARRQGAGTEKDGQSDQDDAERTTWDAQLVFDNVVQSEDNLEAKLLYPFTTTLIEVVFNREPLPPEGENRVLKFLAKQAGDAVRG